MPMNIYDINKEFCEMIASTNKTNYMMMVRNSRKGKCNKLISRCEVQQCKGVLFDTLIPQLEWV